MDCNITNANILSETKVYPDVTQVEQHRFTDSDESIKEANKPTMNLKNSAHSRMVLSELRIKESNCDKRYIKKGVVMDYTIIAIITILFVSSCQAAPWSVLPKLLVVSFDAFRYDYFDRDVTPYLKELKTTGIYADYMISSFTTKTFPNHYTIATGLYVENHGVVDSEYYDQNSKKKISYSYELYHYNNHTTPIWILNEKAGNERRSGVEMWSGGEFEYGGRTATFDTKWNVRTPFIDRVDEIISWFKHPETPINLAMLYIDEPDFHGHGIGINNDRFNKLLKKMDDTAKYIHTKLKDNGLGEVNVVHVSDHGMATVTQSRIVDLNKYVNPGDYISSGKTPVMSIFPYPGKKQSVYTNLQRAAAETKGFDVYLKQEIPKRYHYGNNSRIGPIVIVNKVGYAFQDLRNAFPWYEKEFNITIDENSEFGVHGYDNLALEMRAIFFGYGPAFLPRCEVESFSNLNLVPLFCDILNIPQPCVDGTLDVFKKCLQKYTRQ